MCNFHIGQKVVCIASEGWYMFPKNEVFTVAAISYCPKCGLAHLHIKERPTSIGKMSCVKHDVYWDSPDFYAGPHYGFRPLLEDYTESEIESVNIDILTKELEVTEV